MTDHLPTLTLAVEAAQAGASKALDALIASYRAPALARGRFLAASGLLSGLVLVDVQLSHTKKGLSGDIPRESPGFDALCASPVWDGWLGGAGGAEDAGRGRDRDLPWPLGEFTSLSDVEEEAEGAAWEFEGGLIRLQGERRYGGGEVDPRFWSFHLCYEAEGLPDYHAFIQWAKERGLNLNGFLWEAEQELVSIQEDAASQQANVDQLRAKGFKPEDWNVPKKRRRRRRR